MKEMISTIRLLLGVLILILSACATNRNIDTSKPYIFQSSVFSPAWVMPDGSFKELTTAERALLFFGIYSKYFETKEETK